ncbi:FabD/lysophospholipase-like protein [Periconia macrospinosa]|uniref:FabD/lysophospholipase-like protein n=1 Tax=Periconia macrospinosa TaxID=97972 RepID=A0A2V1E6E5_9PLEO|nr:FabD/lysophospholipase-like protein [Periconia macrospinosa]
MSHNPDTVHEGSSREESSTDAHTPEIPGNPNRRVNRTETFATVGTIGADAVLRTEDCWRQQNLLSLDGGGIRGYWTLLVLEHLMKQIGYYEKKFGGERARECGSFAPCAYPSGKRERKTTMHWLAVTRIIANFCRAITSITFAEPALERTFRMNVYDCLREYEKMGDRIFGKPRPLPGIGAATSWHKYSAEAMEKALKDVAARRSEKTQRINNVHFRADTNLCKTCITAYSKRRKTSGEERLYLFRSYDHEKKEVPSYLQPQDHASTGHPAITAESKNFGQADTLEIWQVARAATAAPLFFRPIKITQSTIDGENATHFSDGGFGHTNNPTDEGRREIESLHGQCNIGMIVSIGTARGTKVHGKNRLFNLFRDSIYKATDPEAVHEMLVKLDHLKGRYWRLNDRKTDMNVQLDEWEPSGTFVKNPGQKTLKRIRDHFNQWASDSQNATYMRKCARQLVYRRISRANYVSLWEAYAIGAVFMCNLIACPNTKFDSEHDLARHLCDDHGLSEEEIKERIKYMKKRWQYQIPPNGNGESVNRNR